LAFLEDFLVLGLGQLFFFSSSALGLFVSPSVLVSIWAHMTYNLSRYFIYQWMPLYYKERFNLTPSQVGAHMILPEIAAFAVGVLCVPVADSLVKKGWLSLVATRRVLTGLGFLGNSVSLCAASCVKAGRP
jgi:sugar phosphate permease